MPGRAIWKAVVRVGEIEMPVKLYSGIQDVDVHFRLLHDRDRAPVKQMMVSPDSGGEVSSENIQKGAPLGRGRFVVLTDEELASVEPEESRVIEVVRFVPTQALDVAFYDRPYWLGPDGRDDGTYWALVDALSSEEREGIARWVMRKRAYTGALRVRDERLVLITTRHAGEVIEPDEAPKPTGRAPDPKEMAMAEQLVAMLEGPFEPEQYRDEYRDRVLELVKRKARGEKVVLPKIVPKPASAPSLTDALRKSLSAVSTAASPRRAKRRAHG